METKLLSEKGPTSLAPAAINTLGLRKQDHQRGRDRSQSRNENRLGKDKKKEIDNNKNIIHTLLAPQVL